VSRVFSTMPFNTEIKPLSAMTDEEVAGIHTVITDVDDTVTTDGRLTAKAYTALEQLQSAGFRVVVTTGRPAGWCDHIARMWPVDAVVGENGAVYFWYDSHGNKLCSRHAVSDVDAAAHRQRIEQVAAKILRAVPGAAVASDQFCRLYDLAIDFCEDVAFIGQAGVDAVVAIMASEGMTAKVSSIHVNGWFGVHDKLSTSMSMMQHLYDIDLNAERSRIVYAGDSPNDATMFAHFPISVGVANVLDFVGKMSAMPKFVTNERSGAGFAELADRLLSQLSTSAQSRRDPLSCGRRRNLRQT